MFLNKRTTAWLTACASLCGVLVLSSFAAAQKKGGGGSSPPPLPADMKVRYRVEFIPLPTNASDHVVHDVNDVREAVGAYNDVGGFRVGYYYNAVTNTLLTAKDMIPSLPAPWVSTSFVGINNGGAIVGKVQDILGFSQCLLIFPPIAPATEYTYEITAPVDASGPMDSHFSKINDSGDIVGISWDDFGVGLAFAYNPGLFPSATPTFTSFGSPYPYWNAMKVSNARLGTVNVGDKMFWFDFVGGKEYQAVLPVNVRGPIESNGLSNDGQITVNEAIFQQKGNNGSYRYKPGIMIPGSMTPGSTTVSMNYVWQGSLDDGYTTLVNSAVGLNLVGDVVGFNEISRVRWLRHADHPVDWGYLNLGAMVVFSSVADADRWSLIPGVRVWGMSDRDQTTGFGVLIGHYSAFSTNAAYVLIPEIIP